MYRYCPNCESKNVIIFEHGEDESYCVDCAFTWRQTQGYITVSRVVIKQLVGLRGSEGD